MADEGKFEPGFEGDVMPSLDVVGEGTIDADGNRLLVRVVDDSLRLVEDDKGKSSKRASRKRMRELSFDWEDVLAVSNDSRDPRVIVMVIDTGGEARMLRFRPMGATQPLVADLQWMAANGGAFDEDDDGDFDDVRAQLAKMGVKVEVQRCTGPGCKLCAQLREMQQSHAPS